MEIMFTSITYDIYIYIYLFKVKLDVYILSSSLPICVSYFIILHLLLKRAHRNLRASVAYCGDLPVPVPSNEGIIRYQLAYAGVENQNKRTIVQRMLLIAMTD